MNFATAMVISIAIICSTTVILAYMGGKRR